MSKIGDQLADLNDEFAEWFEDPMEITNFEDSGATAGPEEYDDPNRKTATANSPISTTGQVDTAEVVGVSATGTRSDDQPWGSDVVSDVVIFLPDDVTVSDGEEPGLSYASEVRVLPTDRVYRIEALYDEGNGRLVCPAQLISRRG